MQHRQLYACCYPSYCGQHIEFQYGTSACYIFITGLNATGINAETNKKFKTESKVSSWELQTICSRASVQEAAGSQELSIPEPRPRVKSRKHSVCTHFPKDQIVRYAEEPTLRVIFAEDAPAIQSHAPKRFGDPIVTDHQVLNKDGVSRNSHRYAVNLQDLATQWLQADPCKTTTSQETEEKDKSISSRMQVQR